MSNSTLRAIIAFVGILAVVWAAQRASDMTPISLTASSRDIAKIATEHPLQGGVMRTDKARGPLLSSINRVGGTTQTGQPFLLEATVVSVRPVDGTTYHWQVPPGVHLINGAPTGVINYVDSKHPVHVQATFQQTISGNKQIHFVATAEQNGLKFASVSQFNSLNEDFIRDQRQSVLNSLKNTSKTSAMH